MPPAVAADRYVRRRGRRRHTGDRADLVDQPLLKRDALLNRQAACLAIEDPDGDGPLRLETRIN